MQRLSLGARLRSLLLPTFVAPLAACGSAPRAGNAEPAPAPPDPGAPVAVVVAPPAVHVPDEPRLPISTDTPADVAAPPADAEFSASGLASKVLQVGQGSMRPGPRSNVTVHYSGWTTDGKLFDSSLQRNRTASFGLHQVIAGWTEGLQLMVEGEARRFWIPAALAYGETPMAGRPAGMLVFDVLLLKID